VRFCVVGNLKAHARPQGEHSAVLECGAKFSLQAIQNVPFDAPVVRDIAGRALDDPNADVAELLGPPGCRASLAWMLGSFDIIPLRDNERKTADVHLFLLRRTIAVPTDALVTIESLALTVMR
jgi:hypothetical protein